MAVSLSPYLVVGESWGMVWMNLNTPLSFVLENTLLADYWYPVLYVACTTVANGSLIGGVVVAIRAASTWRSARAQPTAYREE
jgi:hypothetical protein